MARFRQFTAIAAAVMLPACSGSDRPIEITDTEDDSWFPGDFVTVSDGPEASIYAIGIYQGPRTKPGDERVVEPVRVTIAEEDGEAIQLALSSYSPIEWIVEGEGARRVDAIYMDGYHRHSVTGISGARIINRSGRINQNLTQLSDDWGGSSAAAAEPRKVSSAYEYYNSGRNFVLNAEAALNREARAYAGIYYGEGFEITE